MKKKWIYFICFCVLITVIGWGIFQTSLSQAGGPGDNAHLQSPAVYDYTDQLIVKYRNPSFVKGAISNINNSGPAINTRVNALSATAGVTLTHFRFMSGDGHVLKLPQRMTLAEATAVAQKLAADPGVEYAEPDRRMYPMATPNDPQYTNQWHYMAPATEIGGVNLPGAWDITTGSSSIVVAVIDTGIRFDHADLAGRTVTGYNFISDAWMAGNGSAGSPGRSADASDLGDWVAVNDCDTGSKASDSSWHGTHVAGTIGAKTNNSVGVAGINWTSKILPVRVLGKCGGYDSDIIDGMRWAAGLSVSGVPANANPAKVLNLSLGGDGSCDSTWQRAITDVTNKGATVVVAAGNSTADAAGFTPANCTGVISVAATNRSGGRASYSNYGTIVKIAAPGGAQSVANDPNGVLSTLNTGTTTPVADSYQYYQGTSMAAPHVAGIASLMLSANPSLTPALVLSNIQSTARAFPGSGCTPSTPCGAGIIDAAAAVSSVASTDMSIAIAGSPSSVIIGANVTYTITVTNNGPNGAPNVTVTDTLPADVIFVSATPSQGSCSGTSIVTCDLGTMNTGSTATPISLVVKTTAANAALTNSASVISDLTDPTPGNNTATSNSTVVNNPPPAPAGGGGGGGGGCFIATAAFGSPLEKHVQILRDFRDRVLLNSSAGKTFVQFYYRNSPAIADKIAQSEGLRLITRIMLMPVIGVAYLIMHLGMFMTLLLFTIFVLTVIFTIRKLRKKMRKFARAEAAA
jgi:serine protease